MARATPFASPTPAPARSLTRSPYLVARPRNRRATNQSARSSHPSSSYFVLCTSYFVLWYFGTSFPYPSPCLRASVVQKITSAPPSSPVRHRIASKPAHDEPDRSRRGE